MNAFLMLAAIAVMGPAGEKVCDVTPPALPPEAVVETTNFAHTVAWRIRYNAAGPRKIAREEWVFDFGRDLRCWPVSHAQGEYVPKRLSTMHTMRPCPGLQQILKGRKGYNYVNAYPNTAESPFVVEGDSFTAVLGDAGCLDSARIRFAAGAKPGQVKTVLEGEDEFTAPAVTPWRYIHVAKDAVALANEQPAVMDALNAPSRLAQTSWIKPGKVLRVARLTTKDGLDAVAFVKRNHFQFIEIDAGWYGPEQTGDPLHPKIDPRRAVKGEPFDLQAILAEARARGVGAILYVNGIPLAKNRDAILDQLAAWGVAGVKYGFVQVGSAACRRWVREAIEAAAARRIMVDIHDEYRLTGIQKTYPNVMTVEGIRGNEEMPPAAHNAALPFTRFLDGPGDYTPCWRVSRIKTTLAHQLALPVVFTSGWQFLYWYQCPRDIDEKEGATAFWCALPASFDETRVLAGKIGEGAVVARREGTTWYLGAINAGARRPIEVPLDFAGPGEKTVRLFRDADAAQAKPCAPVAVETRRGNTLLVDCAANGGFAAIVTTGKAGEK